VCEYFELYVRIDYMGIYYHEIGTTWKDKGYMAVR
jgi:hypothetical protein